MIFEHTWQNETVLHQAYVDDKVTSIVDASVDYQDSEILEEWEDLFDVHTLLEEIA